MTETHLTKGQSFEIADYKSFHNPYSTVEDPKPRGGISCFIQPNYINYVTRVNTDISENVSVHFKNGDVIFGVYIAPVDSHYHDLTDFSNVANMFVPKNSNCVVLGGGDLNGRVGDSILNEHRK